jgi:prolyl oligopeptidase
MLTAALSGQAVYYHWIGTPQSHDRLIYERKDLADWFETATISEDGKYLAIALAKGADNSNRLYYADLGDPKRPVIGAPVKPLIEEDGAELASLGNNGPVFYLRTDRATPNRKVVKVDLKHPASTDWMTVVPEGKYAIEAVALIGGHIVAQYLLMFGLDGKPRGDVPLPGTGSIEGFGGRQDTPEIFYTFSAPLIPRSVYRHDLPTQKRSSFDPVGVPFDSTPYETTEHFATSKDGTRVPFFITGRKGLRLDGSNPAMLYGSTAASRSASSPGIPTTCRHGWSWEAFG